MVEVGMFEAKTHFSQLIDALVSGQTDCISILRHRRPVARITLPEANRRIKLGVSKGKYKLPSWEEDKVMDSEIESMFAESTGIVHT